MEEIVVGGTGKGKEREIALRLLEYLASRGLSPTVEPMSAKVKGIEIFSETEPLEWGGSEMLPVDVSESEVRKGIKSIEELELSEIKGKVDELVSTVESVKSDLQKCKKGISTILNELRELKEKPAIKQTELFDIGDGLEVIKPIPVVIEEYSNEVIASFTEIGAFGDGLCESEAIINLKREIRKIFFELEEFSDDKLGKLPLSWKRVLFKVVRKIGNSK
jgi:uncharacterized coiled-coil DUF342 family protein